MSTKPVRTPTITKAVASTLERFMFNESPFQRVVSRVVGVIPWQPVAALDLCQPSISRPRLNLNQAKHIKKGSSPIFGDSGEGGTDFEEEVLVITEAVGHALDDLDLLGMPSSTMACRGERQCARSHAAMRVIFE